MRRAFEELRLNGILCLQNAPAVYFRELPAIEQQEFAFDAEASAKIQSHMGQIDLCPAGKGVMANEQQPQPG